MLMFYVPVINFSVMLRWIIGFLGCTSTKQQIKFLTQRKQHSDSVESPIFNPLIPGLAIYHLSHCAIVHSEYIKIISVLIKCQKCMHTQGLHWLEKYLNLEGFHEKYLKIKSVLKSSGKSLKRLEFYYFLWDLALMIET